MEWRIEKEGLFRYQVFPAEDNEYFYAVEYKTIRKNRPPVLLGFSVRETDNIREIYYDISGKRSLSEWAKEEDLTCDLCKKILRGIITMMKELQEYLMEPDYICYDPEGIYLDGDRIFWIYGPSRRESVQDELEALWSWLLSRVNSGEGPAVQFVYKVFWMIRKQGFSVKAAQNLLSEAGDPEACCGEIERGSEILTGEGPQKPTVEEINHDVKEERPGKKIRPAGLARGFFLISGAALTLLAFSMIAYGYLYGLTDVYMNLLYVGLGGGVLSWAILAGLSLWTGGKEKDRFTERREEPEYGGDDLFQARNPWDPEEESPVNGEEEWESNTAYPDREGTTILCRSMRRQPVLKSLDTGEFTRVRECPFYIGSDPVLNQMVLIDRSISRQHAVIMEGKKKDTYRIRDMGSTNGTWIRGRQVHSDSPDALEDGCIVCFAQKKYRFMIRENSL